MTEYVATCNASSLDTITARRDGDAVELEAVHNGEHKMETYLSASKARVFARGILALADEINRGEAKEEEPSPLKPGDKIRILVDDAEYADVSRGDVFTVHEVRDTLVVVDDPANDGYWYFRDAENWEKVVTEPAPLADWERDLMGESPADEPEPVVSRHAAHVRAAKELLAGVEHTSAADVIHLAQFLADE